VNSWSRSLCPILSQLARDGQSIDYTLKCVWRHLQCWGRNVSDCGQNIPHIVWSDLTLARCLPPTNNSNSSLATFSTSIFFSAAFLFFSSTALASPFPPLDSLLVLKKTGLYFRAYFSSCLCRVQAPNGLKSTIVLKVSKIKIFLPEVYLKVQHTLKAELRAP